MQIEEDHVNLTSQTVGWPPQSKPATVYYRATLRDTTGRIDAVTNIVTIHYAQ